ncbi:MAG: aminopeptidase, partial [Geovibrio sp.]|nr:aminopeptidase [Geovibrio sp.]
YLGEVALVQDDSPISNTGILFNNTLFDENASVHFQRRSPISIFLVKITACDNNYQEINPNTEQTYNVTFSPTSNGTFNTSFEIISNAGYRTIYLTGTAQQASIDVPNLTNNTLNFGSANINTSTTQSFRIRNSGQVSYIINIQSVSPF